ncbi:MAG TPA: ABC transporter ATP-binding protein, partial [Devosia sp.]|nr:ABC transporter ATP-binding protein [Devosia sp.]
KLRDISARHGHTLVYVTHDQNEAMTLAEQVVVMDSGRVVQMGTPQELFENPVHPHVGYFIGTPSMNFLPGKLLGGRVEVLGHEVGLPISSELNGGSEILVGIRPEFISLSPKAGKKTIPGSVVDIQDMGGFAILSAKLSEEHELKVRVRERVPPIGGPCHLELQPDRVCFYVDDRLIN